MAIMKCKMCGGDLTVPEGQLVAECEFCGTKQTLPKINEEIIRNLFNRANALRLKCEFDKAEQIYEKIIQENDAEPEAHWGVVLCKYGIEYVEDPKTYQRIPTCHRTSYDAIVTDPDYLAAVQYADTTQRGIYEAEAKTIDEIQKNILSIVKEEKPFDVFLCYKETDENGKRTIDSAIANDIYYQLTQEGLKVFYAAITLEDKLGQAYEPYIFAALNSAKVMLVIGTKPQYFSAVWVKNEWSRFLKLMKSDRSKLLIPCYKDMDAYELPEEFSHLQAQDMAKIGFINDVVRGIRKVIAKEEVKAPVVQETVVTESNTNTAPLLKRAFMFLEDGDWNAADEYCEKVLDIDPENASAYLGKLMAQLRVKVQDDLKDLAEPFDSNNNYQKAIRFADEKLKTALTGYIDHIVARNETQRLEQLYNQAKSIAAQAKQENMYLQAASLFENISDYKDSAALAADCREQAEIARKDAIYAAGKTTMVSKSIYERKTIDDYEKAIKIFASIPGWKDADALIVECREKIAEIKAKEESDRLERERKAEIARKEAERIAKRNKKIAIITTPIVCAIIAFIIVLNTVIIPNNKYNEAIALRDEGKVVKAYDALIALDGYKDSAELAAEIYDEYSVVRLKDAKVGDYITFGTHEQDNNTQNGKEDIEWLVLDQKAGKILIISKYALDCKPYHTSGTDVTWETCTLRTWLNEDFINAAFSADERTVISTVTVSADKNPEYSTKPGNATQDQVFLLSITEAKKYFSSDSARRCAPTGYAVANGAYNKANGCCWWWLRSPGNGKDLAAYVYAEGGVRGYGTIVNNEEGAVRPAMWIDLNLISNIDVK